MERAHRARLQRRFKPQLKRARVICLDIPDDYAFMQPELVALLKKKVGPFLRSTGGNLGPTLSSRPKRSGEPGRDGTPHHPSRKPRSGCPGDRWDRPR